MNSKMLLSIAASLAVSACAVGSPKVPNRAAVVLKIDDTEGYICMGVGEVKPGDRVSLYKQALSHPAVTEVDSSGVDGRALRSGNHATFKEHLAERPVVLPPARLSTSYTS